MEGFNTYSTEHGVKGYVVRAQRSYDYPLKGHNVHDEWDNHSPIKVHEFFDKIHDEASRPTHPTLMSSPKWTTKPSWRSHEDHDSPKYGEHQDWENSSGSPFRDRFEGLHLQDNRGSSPFSPKKDGHFKDYGVSNRWDSPPKFKVYVPCSYFPPSYSAPRSRKNYPERSQGGKPMASPISTQPSFYPTTNPITKRKESYPEPTKGMKPPFSPGSAQQPHFPTTNATSQNRENYPNKTQGWNPSFNPSSPKKEHYPPPITTPQTEDYYSDDISPYEYTEEPRYGTRVPPKERMDGREAKAKFGNLKPLPPSKMKYTETIDSKEAVKRYKNAFVP